MGSHATDPLAVLEDFKDKKRPWKSLSITRGDLFIVDTKYAGKDLIFPAPYHWYPPFIRIPRKSALSMTKMENSNVSH